MLHLLLAALIVAAAMLVPGPARRDDRPAPRPATEVAPAVRPNADSRDSTTSRPDSL